MIKLLRWMRPQSVLLIAASTLAARKLSQFDGGKRHYAIGEAVRWAEEIMKGY